MGCSLWAAGQILCGCVPYHSSFVMINKSFRALLEVEGGMRDALLDVVSTLKYKAENHQHEEE